MNVAILLSGGKGTRMKMSVPKQLIKVNDKPLMCYALAALFNCSSIDGVQVVLEEKYRRTLMESMEGMPWRAKLLGFTKPGDTRQESIYHALCDLEVVADEDAVVVIHDGARPMVSCELIRKCVAEIKGYDGVLPVLAMMDTLYSCKNGTSITGVVNRNEIYAGQAPEAFMLKKYYEANKELARTNQLKQITGSAEAAMYAGMNIKIIPGEQDNFKITTSSDLVKFMKMVGNNKLVERTLVYEGTDIK